MLSVGMLVLSACNKSNVKYGNKRIVGTWELKNEISELEEYNYESHINTPSHCYYENSETETKTKGKRTFDGINYTENLEFTVLNSDGTTSTIKQDTTYRLDLKETFTFNEDGTFVFKYYKKREIEENDIEQIQEISGTWNWIDSYKEKAGINISFRDNNGSLILTISELKKKELKFNYSYKSILNEIITRPYTCIDYDTNTTKQGTYVHKTNNSVNESGSRLMIKQ